MVPLTGKSYCSVARKTWIYSLSLSFISFVILGDVLNLSVPCFFHL